MSEVRVKENESLDSALRRFKRQCAKSERESINFTYKKEMTLNGRYLKG